MGLRATIEGWGATPTERATPRTCDALVPDGRTLVRAVDVSAPAELVFRWLCQLRAAPYSYDLLDNLGRRSPQELTPGLERLELGQGFMTIFVLRDWQPDCELTLEHRGRPFGHVAVTYRAEPRGERASRLVMRLVWAPPRVPGLAPLLAGGDLLMSRRQLLNLKALAEGDAASRPPPVR